MKTPLTAIEMTEMIDKATWLYAASQNPAFSFLAEPDEDIYELNKEHERKHND